MERVIIYGMFPFKIEFPVHSNVLKLEVKDRNPRARLEVVGGRDAALTVYLRPRSMNDSSLFMLFGKVASHRSGVDNRRQQ